MKTSLTRNAAIDCMKFIAAILVVGIHTEPFGECSTYINFFFQEVLFRIAVPFFAVCTGYYLTKTLNFQNGKLTQDSLNRKAILRVGIRHLGLYVSWSIIYFLILSLGWIKNGTFTIYSLGWRKSFLLGSSYYHLWYLYTIVLALVPFYIILRKAPINKIYAIISILWIIEVIEYSYRPFIPFINLFPYFDFFSYVPISLTRMLPLLLVGSLVARRKPIFNSNLRLLTCIFFIALCIETLILRSLGGSRFSYVLTTLPLSYCFFSLLLIEYHHLNLCIKTTFLAKISLSVYCLHPAIIWTLKELKLVTSSFMLFVVTCIITIFLSMIYLFGLKRVKEKNEKTNFHHNSVS